MDNPEIARMFLH